MNRIDYIFNEYALIDKTPLPRCEYYEGLVLEPGSVAYADNITFIMRCKFFMGDVSFIQENIDEVIEIYTENNDLVGTFFAYTAYGLMCRQRQHLETGRKFLSMAQNISYKLNDFRLILSALMNFMTISESSSSSKLELETIQEAKKYLEEVDNIKVIADFNNNYGYLLNNAGRYKESIAYSEKAYSLYTEYYGTNKAANALVSKENIGKSYYKLKEYDKAIEILTSVRDDAVEIKNNLVERKIYKILQELYAEISDYKNAYINLKAFNELENKYKKTDNHTAFKNVNSILALDLDKTKEKVLITNIELKKKTIELEKTIENLNIISNIGRKMTLIDSSFDLFELVLDSVYDNVKADAVALFLINEENNLLECKFLYENGERQNINSAVSLDDKNSIAAYAIRNHEDILIKDLSKEHENYTENGIIWANKTNEARIPSERVWNSSLFMNSVIYCRLLCSGKVLGLITLQSVGKNVYSKRDFETIQTVASYVAISIANSIKNSIIKEKAEQLKKLSYYDQLTGLMNRRSFVEYTDLIMSGEVSFERIGLIVSDMNYLKTINDNMGHIEGDKYLINISKTLANCGENYNVYRLNGDEFAVIIFNEDIKSIEKYISKVRDSLHKIPYEVYPLSLAIGISYCDAPDCNIREMFIDAETKMYKDKEECYKKSKFERRRGKC